MKEEQINKVIVTFADYVEVYCDRESTADDIPAIVNEHFNEFIEWAHDDLVISDEDQKILLGFPDPGMRESIKQEVVQEFRMILNLKNHPKTARYTLV